MDKKRIISFINGFTISLILTVVAYLLVVENILSGWILLTAILTIAILQFIVQLLFFLNLGQETGPRWKLTIFISTLGLVLMIIIGSLWIMNHLNYNMMSSPQKIEQYTQTEDAF